VISVRGSPYDWAVRHVPGVLEICLLATILVWISLELRQALHVRREAHKTDQGSIVTLRLAAFAGFVGGVLLAKAVPAATIGPVDVVGWIGLAVVVSGVALRAWCFHTLGHYFTLTVQTSADQPVITAGPYRVLRHPSYTGLLLALLGVAMVAIRNWLSLLVVAVAVGGALVYRIRVEERALLRDLGANYRSYADTHKRLVPFVW
jgi:protein-S-isoprenylcysteine O-methyltransferase Ste14